MGAFTPSNFGVFKLYGYPCPHSVVIRGEALVPFVSAGNSGKKAKNINDHQYKDVERETEIIGMDRESENTIENSGRGESEVKKDEFRLSLSGKLN